MLRRTFGWVVAGVLCANSLPHLATAAAGREMMTPLGGKNSNRWINLLWGGVNLAGGLVLMAFGQRRDRAWDRHLVAFSAGAAGFLAWAAIGEAVFRFNAPTPQPPRTRRGHP